MRLQNLIKRFDLQLAPGKELLEKEVKSLAYDSRKVATGCVFFAVPGFTRDGHEFVEQAFLSGAIAAVVSDKTRIPQVYHDQCILVKDVRRDLAVASGNFYSNPSKEMLVIGVTGTKGKTSTAFLLESICKAAGKSVALLGTVVCRYPGKEFHSERTTMESLELQDFLRNARDAGADTVVMEVSSHALTLDRVYGVLFDGMVFTNLTEDHLDFYENMENYYQAKKLLFTNYVLPKGGQTPVAAIGIDNEFGRRLKKETSMYSQGFGLQQAEYSGEKLHWDANGMIGSIRLPSGEELSIKSGLTGAFNAQNILAAATIASELKISPAAIASGIKNLTVVDGRLQRVDSALPFSVFVDFAHMGAALENVLQTLRPICKRELVVVFGAGGDRDPARRVQLGEVAARLADRAWITSDNPRTEDPLVIIAAIEKSYREACQKRGLSEKRFTIEPDRKAAIEKALRAAMPGDVICIAGKGHETGQIIGKKEFPFDDRIEASKVLKQLEIDLDSKN